MTILNIVTYPDPFLRKPTDPVTEFDDELARIVEDMGETMYQEPGVGLAAIQVGLNKSLIVYDVSGQEGGRNLEVLVNPEIISQAGSVVSENEGCLSVPDFRADVKRFASVRIKGQDRTGTPVEFDADGFKAIVLQHEIDHLNGILFIDRISALKRQLYKRKVKKQLKNQ